MIDGRFPVKYSFCVRNGCNDTGGMCRDQNHRLRAASLNPTSLHFKRYEKKRTSMAGPGIKVLSTSKNAATRVPEIVDGPEV